MDPFLWEYYCLAWNSSVKEKEKCDPLCERCYCGYSFRPSLFEKIIILICGKYVKRCPQCGTTLELKMSYNVYVNSKKKNLNEEIWLKG